MLHILQINYLVPKSTLAPSRIGSKSFLFWAHYIIVKHYKSHIYNVFLLKGLCRGRYCYIIIVESTPVRPNISHFKAIVVLLELGLFNP